MNRWDTAPVRSASRADGYEAALPAPTLRLVRERRAALVADAAGNRVLDLGGAPAHHLLWDRRAGGPPRGSVTVLEGPDDPALAALAADGQTFDTVVSVMALSTAEDLTASLATVRDVLASEGELLFLDRGLPAARTRRASTPGRDIPMTLRAGGLSVTRLDRHRIRTLRRSSRALVEGRAHHTREPNRPDAD